MKTLTPLTLLTLACSTPKRAQVGQVVSFTDIQTNVHSFGYYSRDEGPKDSAYINIEGDDNCDFQIRIAREELDEDSSLLNNHDYIDFRAENHESGQDIMHFLILHNTIQASKK
ncbi:MAG: hypothetical protein PF590_07290 [Candidatus Delongbacteria bacterium]|jgi:hypothetical protein|nr:hypothetical protein [Candidatus Delongbacteria bacterium]